MKKISDLIEELEEIKEQYGDLPLVYSHDEEGNYFSPVYFDPGVGNFDKGDFIPEEHFEEYEKDFGVKPSVNSVCLN